jgi:hypothetical protein
MDLEHGLYSEILQLQAPVWPIITFIIEVH